jgi:DNA-binding IclR family transcriptional regulator
MIGTATLVESILVVEDAMAPVPTSSMVDRVTSIIDAFDDVDTGLSLDQVATRAALPRSTTHRILDQLVRLKWLQHSEHGYGLGARAVSWGAGDAADFRLREAAAPVLHDLHRIAGCVAHLGVLDGPDVVHVDKLGGAFADRVPTRVGTRLPAASVALGVAALAGLPPESVDTSMAVALHRVRRTGGVVCVGDYARGLTSVAALVAGRAAVGIVVPDNASGGRFLPLVVDAALRIRRTLD